VAALSITTPRLRRGLDDALAPAPLRKMIGGLRLLRRLGAGGMSEVYLAYDQARHCPVAVKVLPDDLARNATYVQRFQRESALGQKIDHPNIVRCLEDGQDQETGSRYFVMEYVKGQSGQSRLERMGPLPVAEATQVMLDVARALEEIHHRGYVHRDVKPGNILIAEDGRAKLADLGVAKKLADTVDLTSFDQGIGTPYYMPWEQSLNASLVDPRSDLFSLGATFYHLVTGRVPFPGKDVAEVARLKEEGEFVLASHLDPKLPRSIDAMLAKLLARMPKDRFQTASQLIDALTASGLTGDNKPASALSETEMPSVATRADLKSVRQPRVIKDGPIWIYQYRHGSGWKRGRARTEDIVQWFEERVLPDEFFLAKAGQKTCRNYKTFAEFRDLKRKAPPAPSAKQPKKTRSALAVIVLGIGVAIVLTATVSTILHFLWDN